MLQAQHYALTLSLLDSFAADLGADRNAYQNHVCRLLHFYAALSRTSGELPAAVQIAAAFHDIGIWTDQTFDYLEPSVRRAQRYLAAQGQAHLNDEVAALITRHHKLRCYTGAYADRVECFRRADWLDVSLGALRFGLARSTVRAVQRAFPNNGFHWRLLTLTGRQFLKNPLRPLPMMRW